MNLLTRGIVAIVVLGLPTLYFACRSREFCKFLAGAFFVSAGNQFYLYLILAYGTAVRIQRV